MPEGPEIRREADHIAAVLVRQPLRAVVFGLPRLERFGQDFTGEQVLGVQTLGKAMLTHFSNGMTMYSHNQLYGRWMVCRRDRPPQTNRSLRVALHTDSHSALLYSASDIDLLPTSEVAEHPFIRKLGLDVLDSSLTWRAVAEQLADERFARRRLSSLYLDQSALAGVGNYLRSEILFDAKLSPLRRPVDLKRGELGRLARSTLSLCQRAYQTGGVTNPPARAATLKREGKGREGYRFAVFGRSDRPCYTCGAAIVRLTATSRRLYQCLTCQPDP